MRNAGKQFEAALKKSVPDYALLYRLPDPAQSFGNSSKTRFSRHNPFDFMIFNPKTRTLYALEAKTVAGKSISFERAKGEHGVIHYYQVDGLNEWDQYDGTVCGFIIEFREIETTIFLSVGEFNKISLILDKKSFNLCDLDQNQVSYYIIPQEKKRTQYSYDIEKFLSECKEKKKNG